MFLKEQQAIPVIPEKNRRVILKYDKIVYKKTLFGGMLFNKVKNLSSSGDSLCKMACTFKSFFALATIIVWLA
jgi:hypothetical protein